MSFRHSPLVVCLLAVVMAPAAVRAGQAPQGDKPAPEQVRRPFRGIFGGPPDPSSKQSLIASGSVFAAYDDDVFADRVASADTLHPGVRQDGIYSGMTAGLDYLRNANRGSLGLTADVGVNKYKNRDPLPTYRVGANLSAQVARRTSFAVSGTAMYSPEFRLGVFTSSYSLAGSRDGFTSVVADFDLYSRAALRTSTTAGLTQSIGHRGSLDATYSLTNVDYINDSFNYKSQTAGLRYLQRLTRNMSARLGYGYTTARYSQRIDFRPQDIHHIDAGIDYSRALSVSRRTRVSFSTGSAIVSGNGENFAGATTGFSYHLTGSADLTHEMGRTWKAQLSYRRGIEVHEGFAQPFLSNALTGGLDGLLSRRLAFGANADYVKGNVGLSNGSNYNSLSTTTALEYALSSRLALFARYVYYKYEFDRQVALDPRLPRALDRQGVRFGLSTSIPVIR
jgi:hypothetical protein